jgi:hypothetical protein
VRSTIFSFTSAPWHNAYVNAAGAILLSAGLLGDTRSTKPSAKNHTQRRAMGHGCFDAPAAYAILAIQYVPSTLAHTIRRQQQQQQHQHQQQHQQQPAATGSIKQQQHHQQEEQQHQQLDQAELVPQLRVPQPMSSGSWTRCMRS